MKTQAFPHKEIARDTYEIGEFDCASIFMLVGDEEAMVVDTGLGIGDLKGLVRTLTDKPVMVSYTHDHIDHVGGASAFDHAYVHPLGETLGEDVLPDAITACEKSWPVQRRQSPGQDTYRPLLDGRWQPSAAPTCHSILTASTKSQSQSRTCQFASSRAA